MFSTPRPSSPRQRTASCSTDDQSQTRDRPRKPFHRHHTHDLATSSHSLATTYSHHDDLPAPSFPASHTTSTQSTPMTSPSTGYSSLFPASLSSATSESVPSPESKYRSEFGMLIPGSSSAHSAVYGSASSRSSNPASRSPTESDSQASAPPIPYKHPHHLSHVHRPLTAPNSPSALTIPGTADASPTDNNTRPHSRLTVSIKNLFSRHAVPSPSRFSFNSVTTTPDSEASSSSFQVPAAVGKWSMTPRKSRPPDLEISGTVAPVIPSPGCGSNSPIDAHRRYASEAVAKFYNVGTVDGLPISQESSIDVSFRNAPPVRGRDIKSRNVLRRRPSGSAKLFKGRERGMSSPAPRPNESDVRLSPNEAMPRQTVVPFPLTPAGALVEAYKQQELHREDTPSPSRLSIDDRMGPTAPHDGGYDRDRPEQSPTPYRTFFGSSSERRVQTDSLDDRRGKLEVDQRIFTRSQATLSHQPSMSDPGGRSLARKLSSRWQKAKGADGVVSEELPLRGKSHAKGRSSLQEGWRLDKSNQRSVGRSMDSTPNAEDGSWASPNAGHARSASKGDKIEGPKLWRLIRRISTGGLRDRYQSSDKAVPPVPAIPKELLKKANPSERNNETSRHHPSSSSPNKEQSQTPTAPRTIAVTRPSVTTSSSSPNSSDVASTQFFHKTHSARSSMSSFGEALVLPRAPESMLDRHIIAPLEQLRLADDHVEGGEPSTPSLAVPRSPRRSMSVPIGLKTTEDVEGDHAPLPSPRRLTCSGESPSSVSSRPCSTSASGTGSARASYQSPGAVLIQSRMADGTVSLSPPPRPARNSTRAASGSVAGSPPQSILVKQADGIGLGGARQMDRTPSTQSDMTARFESSERRRSQGRDRDWDQETSPRTRALLTFRELDAPRRPPLSEREKADIWNDLLERSDKAGGTLHIKSAAELMSDSLRLSTHSSTHSEI